MFLYHQNWRNIGTIYLCGHLLLPCCHVMLSCHVVNPTPPSVNTVCSCQNFTTQDSTQTCTQPRVNTEPKHVPNTTQCKHWSLVPKLYYPRLNPNLYPTPPSVNTERSCQNFNTHRLLYWRLADSKRCYDAWSVPKECYFRVEKVSLGERERDMFIVDDIAPARIYNDITTNVWTKIHPMISVAFSRTCCYFSNSFIVSLSWSLSFVKPQPNSSPTDNYNQL